MKQPFTRSTTLANYLVATVLVLVPFHAFMTVWGSTLVGHYTALRLWDDALLVVLVGMGCYWLAWDTSSRKWLTSSLLFRLILGYASLTLLLGAISYLKGDVTAKALAYGLLVNLRYLAWFVAVLLLAQKSDFLVRNWRKLLLVPAATVLLFAVLQYTALPHNFLSHFGYNSATTIAPIETINHNSHYIRVQSTLRGANPLGAYLIIVACSVVVVVLRGSRRWWWLGISGALTMFALYASGSRSAWLGTGLALGIIGWMHLKTKRAKKMFSLVIIGVVLILSTTVLLLRNNASVENALLHTQKQSAAVAGSNSAHASALKSGIADVIHQPFGDGPGTAGPASVYNVTHPARIAENYYIQIAQETGWLGLALIVSIMILIGMELYHRVAINPLVLVLFASLAGLVLVSMLSHAWVDDTLAFLWWGLAGIALGPKLGQETD